MTELTTDEKCCEVETLGFMLERHLSDIGEKFDINCLKVQKGLHSRA
jgi:hypothetical protein